MRLRLASGWLSEEMQDALLRLVSQFLPVNMRCVIYQPTSSQFGKRLLCHLGGVYSLATTPGFLCLLQEKKRINKENELVLTSQKTRSQA